MGKRGRPKKSVSKYKPTSSTKVKKPKLGLEIDPDIFSDNEPLSEYEPDDDYHWNSDDSETKFQAVKIKAMKSVLGRPKSTLGKSHCFLCGAEDYKFLNAQGGSEQSFASTRKHWNTFCSLLNLNSLKFEDEIPSSKPSIAVWKLHEEICVDCSVALANVHSTLNWISALEKKLNNLVNRTELSLRTFSKNRVEHRPKIDKYIRAFYSSILVDLEDNASGVLMDADPTDIMTFIGQKFWKNWQHDCTDAKEEKILSNYQLESQDENEEKEKANECVTLNNSNEVDDPPYSPLDFGDDSFFHEEDIPFNSQNTDTVGTAEPVQSESIPCPDKSINESSTSQSNAPKFIQPTLGPNLSGEIVERYGGAAGDALDKEYNLSQYYKYDYVPNFCKGPDFFRCLHRKTDKNGQHLNRRCGVVLKHKCTMRRHLLQVHLEPNNEKFRHTFNKKTFRCPEPGCKMLTKTEISLKGHIRKYHEGDPMPYHCEQEGCTKKFESKSGLLRHLHRVHHIEGLVTKPTCGICGLKCENEMDYRKHRRAVHRPDTELLSFTDNYPFHCKKCEMPFEEKDQLKAHIKLHSAVDPFKCVMCSENFTSDIKLKQHSRNLHTPAPRCTVCGEGFVNRSALRNHLRMHRKDPNMSEEDKEKVESHLAEMDKRYWCKICGLKYANEAIMKEHYDRCFKRNQDMGLERVIPTELLENPTINFRGRRPNHHEGEELPPGKKKRKKPKPKFGPHKSTGRKIPGVGPHPPPVPMYPPGYTGAKKGRPRKHPLYTGPPRKRGQPPRLISVPNYCPGESGSFQTMSDDNSAALAENETSMPSESKPCPNPDPIPIINPSVPTENVSEQPSGDTSIVNPLLHFSCLNSGSDW